MRLLTGSRNVSNKRYSYFHRAIDQYGPGKPKNVVKTDLGTVFRSTTWPWMSIWGFSLIFYSVECIFEHFAAYLWSNPVEFIKNMLGILEFDASLELTGFLHFLGPVMSIKVAKILVFLLFFIQFCTHYAPSALSVHLNVFLRYLPDRGMHLNSFWLFADPYRVCGGF